MKTQPNLKFSHCRNDENVQSKIKDGVPFNQKDITSTRKVCGSPQFRQAVEDLLKQKCTVTLQLDDVTSNRKEVAGRLIEKTC